MALALSGCEGVHLYNEQQDKTVQSAVEAFGKLDFAGYVAAERKAIDELSAADLESLNSLTTARAERTIYKWVNVEPELTKLEKLNEELAGRADRDLNAVLGTVWNRDCGPGVQEFVIGDTKFLPCDAVEMKNYLLEREAKVQKDRLVFKAATAVDPGICPLSLDDIETIRISAAQGVNWFEIAKNASIKALTESSRLGSVIAGPLKDSQSDQGAKSIYKPFAESCVNRDALILSLPYKGRLGNAKQAYMMALSDVTSEKAALSEQKGVYDEAVKQLKKAQASTTKASKILKEKAKIALDALDSISNLPGPLGKEFAASERLAIIQGAIAALAGPEDDGDQADAGGDQADDIDSEMDTAAAIQIAGALPGVLDKAQAVSDAIEAPPLFSLLLSKDAEEARLFRARRALERNQQQISLKAATIRLLLSYAANLEGIQIEANNRSADGVLQNYLRAEVNRTELNALDQEERRLGNQASIDSTEAALLEWKSTLGRPVEALAAYHGGGVKTEQIIALFQAIGVGVIAGGQF